MFLGWQGGALPGELLCRQAFMAAVPFILVTIAPRLAGFDHQWLPSVRSQWLWFPGLVLLLLIVAGLHAWLLSFRGDWWLVSARWPVMRDIAPANVVLLGIMLVLSAPIAEELFWRAYLLPQLMKLTRWPIALLIHSLLFSLSHIPAYWSALVVCFFYGMILGTWRLRFRSLVPLVLAHAILNGVVVGPHFVTQYNSAVQSYSKCREIDRLTSEPSEKAVPALIELMADRNEVVSFYALEVLGKNYRSEAEPYIAKALASSDNYTVERALSAIEVNHFLGLTPQVRALVWSSEDVGIQISAVLALRSIGDEDELRDIVQKHSEERVRHAAGEMLEINASLKASEHAGVKSEKSHE
ncbi:MAG: CPBP family glutamic-type intramembrane protease [Pirellulaceae bacterium]